MSVLDLLARAETSSDLRHHAYFCDVDVIGAAGMAAIHNPGHLAVYRLKYMADHASADTAKSVFILWARRAMIRRGVNPASASRRGVQILMQWLADICQPCGGRGYPSVAGTPTLSAQPCRHCKGSGKNAVPGSGPEHDVARDVIERADDAVYVIRGLIGAKLGQRE